ncbi:alpha/beta hydrolase family protein [Paenibacillus sp. GCM10012307]|uniref:Alpha/beta hydrolase n=1 Tax=Paenibacillus roseus TaxID=2798579 RepID=A0A934J0E0_9BACL|nr:alpha/beta hydrolase [Paenibacillus roseus]MBJ6362537.1 alpha/beta hydrolase [Paenibacillus roseus]
MTKSRSFWRKPQGLLAISLAIMIVASFFAGLFHTSFYAVNVKKISFEAEHGKLTGLLYMPKGAGADNPRPVIITTHGYLNSKEMQDAPAIEMSRRGYIVLALDQYDHGDSRWSADIPVKQMFSTFWIHSQFDAAKYIYEQPFTKKDANGNAYVAVSGHSMGGFSSLLAMYFDEMNALQTGHRMIYAGIAVGADFSYAAAVAPQDQLQAAYGSRTVGVIAGKYDEFFFNKSDAEKSAAELEVKGTVTRKDFVATASGKAFLGLPADQQGVAGQFYTVQSGDVLVKEQKARASETGERIIFTPNQTHPWNHFSPTVTADLIDFYTHAFQNVASPDQTELGAGNQIWWLKEVFNGVALVGFFLLFVPLISLLLKVPFLSRSVTTAVAPIKTPGTGLHKGLYVIAFAFSALIPAILFPTLMDKQEGGLQTLGVIAIVLLSLGVVGAIAGFVTKRKHIGTGSMLLAVVSFIMWLVFNNAQQILKLGSYFNEPTTNQIAYWAFSVALIMAFVALAFHYFLNKGAGSSFGQYGISLNPVTIVASLCTAVVAIVIGYAILFALQAVFGTDFRLWVLAVRTFQIEHVITALKYMPFFLFYYFVSVVALNANTRGRKWGNLLASILNVGGLVLWIAVQYGKNFLTGVALYPGQALNGILLFALVPVLVVAAIYARKVFEKTNNVWLASFLNTILFTMITAANTVLFWNLV